MPGIMAVMDQKDTYAVGWFLYTAPCIWQSLVLFGSCLRSTVRGLCWEKTSGNAVFSASWFDSGYMLLPFYAFLVEFFPYSAQFLVLSGPRCARVTEVASSISLSWCRGRFPRPCCSADHSSSPVAALGQGDRWPCCAGRAVFSCRSRALLCATTGARLRFAVAVHQQGCPHSCRAAETDLHGLACSEDHRDSAVAVCFLVVDAPVVQVVLAMPVVFYDRRAWFRLCRNSWRCRGRSSFPVVDVAVFMQRQVVSRQ